MISRIFIAIACLLLSTGTCIAEAHPAKGDSVLLAIPKNLKAYNTPYEQLSAKAKWGLKRHALRYAMLHPKVWGLIRINKTQNRTLVPIRPFYLRASENKNFRLKTIELDFEFHKAKKNYMKQVPHLKDPVLEIGLNQSYIPVPLQKDGKENKGYAFRLSAFPQVQSGIYFHSRGTYVKTQNATSNFLKVGTPYKVRLEVTPENTSLFINDSLFAELKDKDLSTGLVSLQTSWHPIKLKKLNVQGLLLTNGKASSVNLSGLVETDLSKELNNAQ